MARKREAPDWIHKKNCKRFFTLTCKLAVNTFSSISSTSLRIALSTANATSGNVLSSKGTFLFFSDVVNVCCFSSSSSESLSTFVITKKMENRIRLKSNRSISSVLIGLLNPGYQLIFRVNLYGNALRQLLGS